MGIILNIFVNETITRPIVRLHRRVQKIEQSNWDYQVAIDSKDEIGEFSRAFDSMTARLKNAQDELQNHRYELERQVAERTTELSQRIREIEQQKVGMQNLALVLEISQQRYQNLVNSIDGVVWEAEPNTFHFSFISQQAKRFFGYPLEDWLSQSTFWADHIHPYDREWAAAYCANAVANQQDIHFEYRMITADNQIIWVKYLVTVVVENEQVVKLYGVILDITEQKQAEEKIAIFQLFMETTGEGMGMATLDRKVVYMNPSLRRFIDETTLEGVLNQDFLSYYPQDFWLRA
jgi:PAS domain S-box-containing protein